MSELYQFFNVSVGKCGNLASAVILFLFLWGSIVVVVLDPSPAMRIKTIAYVSVLCLVLFTGILAIYTSVKLMDTADSFSINIGRIIMIIIFSCALFLPSLINYIYHNKLRLGEGLIDDPMRMG